MRVNEVLQHERQELEELMSLMEGFDSAMSERKSTMIDDGCEWYEDCQSSCPKAAPGLEIRQIGTYDMTEELLAFCQDMDMSAD